MHTIRNRILLSVSAAILAVYLLMLYIATQSINNVIRSDSTQMIDLIMKDKTSTLDAYFKSTERAVSTIAGFITETVDPERLKSDEEYYESFSNVLGSRLRDSANTAGNVLSAYFRPNPDVYGSTSGIWYVDNGFGDYITMPPTDIYEYKKGDREHVGWYYEPIEKGQFIWMEPYENKNLGYYMISYVGPVYVNMEFIGILGMDIDMSVVVDAANNIDYEGAFGFIANKSGDIIYHRDYPYGLKSEEFTDELTAAKEYFSLAAIKRKESGTYTWSGRPYVITAESMHNNMIYVLSIPEDTVMQPQNTMWLDMLLAFIIVLTVVLITLWIFSVHLIKPITEITEASTRIAKGELNVSVKYRGKDELGNLADSVRDMAHELREYISYIHTQAFMDAMTGVGNKSAYMDQMTLLNRKIDEGMADFAVAVFDINGLKRVNDNYGHEVGDMLITDAAAAIGEIFGIENTYRIGGDEFIVILENTVPEEMDVYFTKLNKYIEDFNRDNTGYDFPLAVSKGYAFFDDGTDTEYKTVFKRADEAMYHDKEQYYRGRNDRRRR